MKRCALLLLLLTPLHAAAPPGGLGAVEAGLRQLLADPVVADGFAGCLVTAIGERPAAAVRAGAFGVTPYEGERRPEMFAALADKLFAPASNLKLFTAAAALDTLGPDHTLITRVVGAAPPVAGALDRLYLVGGGDPALVEADLLALANAVKARGVQQVGQVVADASRYSGRWPYGWTIDDLPWYYGAEVTALTLGRNHVDVYVAPGAQAGAPARVWMSPANDYLVLDSTVTTGAAGSATNVSFDRLPGRREVLLRGAIAADRKASVTEGITVPDAELYTAHVFTKALQKAGVTVAAAPVVGRAPAVTVDLARHQSPPVATLLFRVLKNSDNLYAELLLREIGAQTAGDGSAAGGLHGVRAFLKAHAIDDSRLRMYDGSGLSRYDLISPRAVVGLLRAMAYHRHRQPFFDALPIAGVDGTLGYRLKGTPAAGQVRAKTGTYNHHSALSGYVTTRDGDLLAISTILNHCTAGSTALRAWQDRFFVTLAGWSR